MQLCIVPVAVVPMGLLMCITAMIGLGNDGQVLSMVTQQKRSLNALVDLYGGKAELGVES